MGTASYSLAIAAGSANSLVGSAQGHSEYVNPYGLVLGVSRYLSDHVSVQTTERYLGCTQRISSGRERQNPGLFLDFWCAQTMRSRIEPMKKIARTLRTHRELLLNYFKARKEFSSGVVEGMNNKAKVTMRRSYGFRTFRVLELALYHSLGKMPEPKLTHEFF